MVFNFIAQAPPPPDYAKVREPLFILNWQWAAIALSVIIGLFLLVLLVRKLRKKKSPTTQKAVIIPPQVIARKALVELEDNIASIEPEPFTVRISSILRRYLEDALEIPAPELTTEEFLDSLTKRSDAPSCLNEIMPDFLTECDLVKFAQQDLATTSKEKLIRQAFEIVDQTETAPREEGVTDK